MAIRTIFYRESEIELVYPDSILGSYGTRTRANHDYKLYLRRAVYNCYKYSFFIRIVRKWNDSLPGYIVHAESLSVFKSTLKIYLNIYWIFAESLAIKFYLYNFSKFLVREIVFIQG